MICIQTSILKWYSFKITSIYSLDSYYAYDHIILKSTHHIHARNFIHSFQILIIYYSFFAEYYGNFKQSNIVWSSPCMDLIVYFHSESIIILHYIFIKKTSSVFFLLNYWISASSPEMFRWNGGIVLIGRLLLNRPWIMITIVRNSTAVISRQKYRNAISICGIVKDTLW